MLLFSLKQHTQFSAILITETFNFLFNSLSFFSTVHEIDPLECFVESSQPSNVWMLGEPFVSAILCTLYVAEYTVHEQAKAMPII